MMGYAMDADCQDFFEYHGNTMIEIVRKRRGVTVDRDWLLFDTVEEAEAYYYDRCDEEEVYCVH